jgi:hypothetical protein
MSHVLCIYSIYKASVSSLRYHSSLDTRTVVRLTAAKFKSLIFSVLGFVCPVLRTFAFS